MRGLVRRVAGLVLTWCAIAVASFALLHAAPGGPFDRDKSVPPEVERALERYYGLALPVLLDTEALRQGAVVRACTHTQLARWFGALLRGDLGPSLKHRDLTVNELLGAGIVVSATVGLLALELAVLLGVGMGLLSAARAGGALDRVLGAVVALLLAVPAFLLGALASSVFGLGLGWFPVAGWGRAAHVVLPAVTLGLPYAAVIARLTRAAALEALSEPYVRTARAKGLRGAAVVLRHVLRPALVPVVQYLGPAAAGLVTGSVAIEAIFNLPGIGVHFVAGALDRDYPLVMGTVLLYATVLLVLNALADLAASVLDPRSAVR
ncbi:MAG: ABC transporter permease [Planctomycetota bacterium]|nr:MAG: ABC transporter permease [Planctomycetota bacterium]